MPGLYLGAWCTHAGASSADRACSHQVASETKRQGQIQKAWLGERVGWGRGFEMPQALTPGRQRLEGPRRQGHRNAEGVERRWGVRVFSPSQVV